MNLYKATRPDGTDFWSGEIDYGAALTSGEIIAHPYFSVSTSPTDCTGMRWPCRLFRIEPVGRAWRNDQLSNKRCCSRLRVVEELPAHEALGPQGEEVAALIERCRTLTKDEIWRLVAARGAAWGAAWGAARDAAWDAARGAAWGAARDAAWAAAWDAALALMTRDLISQEHFDTLYGPWRVIGDDDE